MERQVCQRLWAGRRPSACGRQSPPWGKPLQDLMQRNFKKVASKIAAQDQKMQENPAWVGAMEHGEMSTFMQSTLRGVAMPGARAWLVTVTHGARHSTPTNVPLAGVGCVLVPLSDALFVHGCSMRHVLDQGIAMAIYDFFLTTEQGDRHLKDQTWLVRVPKDDMLFVSPGSCYCVVQWSKDKACKEKFKKEANVAPCAHCLHVPLAVDSWKAHVGEAQLRAMSTMNKETFDAKVSGTMWTERKSFLHHHFEG